MPTFTKIAVKADVAPGKSKTVTVNDKQIALFNVDGTYYALDNTCPHRGGPLGEGSLSNGKVACPWHGWEIDVSTGQSAINPSMKTACYPVKVEGEEVLAEI